MNLDRLASVSGQRTVRLGVDMTTGHGCFAPVVAITGSIDVYTDQIPECRVSDAYAIHCCPNAGCHAPMVVVGARITYTNMLPTHRSGDPLSCGDTSSNGSMSTYAGN